MSLLPTAFLESLKDVRGFDKEAFERVHDSGEQVTSIRINPLKLTIDDCQLSIDSKVPWTQYGYYLSARPSFTFDPLFHAGCYYVQEASGMFLEQALKQTTGLSQPLKVLDLCAAPGGKSTHLQSLLSKESLLLSNEAIRSRAYILKDNILKWGCNNVLVTQNDPAELGRLQNYFDIIVVDAPCSGSGLFRREPEALEEWSLNNVALCSQRQQRIIADIWPALKKNGLFIYATCSYSEEEDEDIIKWMKEELSIENCQLSIDKNSGIVESGGGYRFFPDKIKGEGFFIACLRKTGGEEDVVFKTKNKYAKEEPEQLSSKETILVEKWIKKEGLSLVKHLDTVYAWPAHLSADFHFLVNHLQVIYSGTVIGELLRDKLLPDHALAMSGLVNEQIIRTELNYEQAIDYLKKKSPGMEGVEKGWQLVTYKGYNLGWVNVLANRVNNYYPKSLRILKES